MTEYVTFSYLYSTGGTEAHKEGCKAATRRSKHPSGALIDTETRRVELDTLLEILTNPDEGYVKIHSCLKPIIAARST